MLVQIIWFFVTCCLTLREVTIGYLVAVGNFVFPFSLQHLLKRETLQAVIKQTNFDSVTVSQIPLCCSSRVCVVSAVDPLGGPAVFSHGAPARGGGGGGGCCSWKWSDLLLVLVYRRC